MAIATTIVVVVLTWLFRPYSATSVFMPTASQTGNSRVSGLAAQFGIVLGSSGQESVEFYADLVESHDLLSDVAETRYAFPKSPNGTDSVSGSIMDLYDIHRSTHAETLVKAVQRLRSDIDASADDASGLVTLSVRAPWPALAELINRRILDLVNRFNLQERQSQARAEREFAEERMHQAQAELDSAEADLSHFLEANRTYQSSPRLAFEAARLQRRIDVRQQVYQTVNAGYEQARIDEVRDTPVFTIIDRPEGTAVPSIRLSVVGALALLLGAVLGLGVVVIQEYLDRQRRGHPNDVSALVVELRSVASSYLPPVVRRRMESRTGRSS